MFFRRPPVTPPTFEQRLEMLRQSGFASQPEPDGRVKVSREGCGSVIENVPGGLPRVVRVGFLIGGEIAVLVDGGFQKFWQTPGGNREPALAHQLKTLHAFQEDLREALGLESWYNTSLGTTNDLHLYDRLRDRDRGEPRRPWRR